MNFQVNGKPISANRPIAFRSTCSVRSHAGSRLIRMYSGSPELKPVKTQISIRRLNNALASRGLESPIAGIVTKRCAAKRGGSGRLDAVPEAIDRERAE